MVDQKEGGGNGKDEWPVQLKGICFFSGLLSPSCFSLLLSEMSFVFEVEGCGGDGSLASALMALAAAPLAL